MFSFSAGQKRLPIMKIVGGRFNKEIVYIKDPDQIKHILEEKRKKEASSHKHKRGRSHNSESGSDSDEEAKEEEIFNEIHLRDGYMEPLPNPFTRGVIYVAGPSGSGKSTWCANFIKKWKKMYPDRPIYIFSRLTEDPALDKIKGINRININEDMVKDPIKIEELKNSLCLFDDIDNIEPYPVREAVYQIQNALLETGRHTDTTVLSCAHLLTNYKQSRVLINESTNVVMFPKSGTAHQIKRFLKEYIGLDTKTIQMIMNLPSRWICIKKNYPVCCLYESGVIGL
jgi:hypothetical protein